MFSRNRLIIGSIVLVTLLLLGSASYAFKTNQARVASDHLTTTGPEAEVKGEVIAKLAPVAYTYQGPYTHLGATTEITLQMPDINSSFVGSLSGACNGAIVGKRVGNNVKGSAVGKCAVVGDAEAEFTGAFMGDKLDIKFTGKAGLFSLEDHLLLERK